jgi:cysteine desulfuration protein SufE
MEPIEQEIIDDFALFDTWEEKYQYIIKGCQSSVWLDASLKNGHIYFSADSDSTFVKGEIALLMKVLSGRTPQEILAAPLAFIDAVGLRQHMAVTRANGLNAMVKQMKTYALAHTAQ